MEGNATDEFKDGTLRFALIIRMANVNGHQEFHFQSANEGISDADVVLNIEALVEKLSERLKEQRTAGLKFGANL